MDFSEYIESLEALELSGVEKRYVVKARSFWDNGLVPPLRIRKELEGILVRRKDKPACFYLDKRGYCVIRSMQLEPGQKTKCQFSLRQLDASTCDEYRPGSKV